MLPLKLAAAALNQTPLAWDSNRENILAAIARAESASILCLPELCISGYGCEDAFYSRGIIERALTTLADLIGATAGMIVAFGVPVPHSGGLYNGAVLACDGELLGIVCKQHLAGDGIHYEPRWFRGWSAGAVSEIAMRGQAVPIGDLLFDCGGVRIGFEICEDAWVANRPGGGLARRGADVILNPSASHFAFDKQSVRRGFVLEGSRAFQVSYVYANLIGNEAGRAIYDGGTLIASGGKLLAAGERFSYRDVVLSSTTVDVDATRLARTRASVDPDETEQPTGRTISRSFVFPQCELSQPRELPAWELSSDLKAEELARAVPLALFDYLRKSRAGGFVLSLSGGADSSAVATFVWLMAQQAYNELGPSEVRRKLSHTRHADNLAAPSDLVQRLLTCVYQSTRNSSETTRNAAETLASAIGSEFLQLDIDPIVELYKQTIATALNRPLRWESDDIALQNIQARARGPSVWLLANLRGALLLSTSNRSEAAVGYATMDGDTCGGLAPIAGIDKAYLREWLVWMETTGPAGIPPLSALHAVNQQQPTAELRPHEARQTDEDDLMPYDVLDAIERAAIRDKQVPTEVYDVIRQQFPYYQPRQLGAWVVRFFRLWCRNQWKRERYAPSFHLDDENLDPKTWCRFPILSGGYETELAELQQQLAADAGKQQIARKP